MTILSPNEIRMKGLEALAEALDPVGPQTRAQKS